MRGGERTCLNWIVTKVDNGVGTRPIPGDMPDRLQSYDCKQRQKTT